jgi:hypothetical protein
MRVRVLGVQAGLTSVANEVVVLVMVGGDGSTAARGLMRRRRARRLAATVGRMRALWICLARSRIWTARVIVSNETTGVPLTALCSNRNFMGTIVNIGGKNFVHPAHGLPANADKWASVMGGDGWWTRIACWDLGQRLSFYFGYWRWRVGQPLFSFEWNVLP